MNIGSHKLTSKVLLAPMAGTSDKPFRMICRDQGAGLTTSEMVVIQNHLLNSNKSKHRLDFSSEQLPISIQIAGSEAQELADSAIKALEFGADILISIWDVQQKKYAIKQLDLLSCKMKNW